MSELDQNADTIIKAYRRRRERMVPLILGGLAVVLLVVGLFLVVIWFTGETPPILAALRSSPTPTHSATASPPPPSLTPTITPTPEPSQTPTPEGPRTYTVELNDTLTSIADKFDVDVFLIIAYNNLPDPNNIPVGTELLIPAADAELPTETPLPTTLRPGDKISYLVRPGDTLESIAAKFNSTAEAIAKENKIEDPNSIGVGIVLRVPFGIATPTPSHTPDPRTPTATRRP